MRTTFLLTVVVLALVTGCKNAEKSKAACQANLRKIVDAKEQLALEKAGPLGNPIPAGWVPAESEVLLLTKMKSLTCPGGGAYSINAHDMKPVCSIALHNEP